MTGVTRGAVFVLPVTPAGQQGPVAAMLSTAGWASAARRVLGAAWIVTPDGVLDPEAARRAGSAPMLRSRPEDSLRRRLPTVVKTATKDARAWMRARRFRVDPAGPWRDHEVEFVWQRHELFHDAGVRLAHAIGSPVSVFAPAPLVWESEQWGVHRPGWGRLTERLGEARTLRAADVVACGSDVVAEQARRLGVESDRIVVTPTGVDVDAFDAPEGTRRGALGLDGRFVVGWVGSFRGFHALDQVVAAVDGMSDTTLLFVGDGPDRPRVERTARARGVDARFTGTVSHERLASYLACMDAAVVVAPAGQPFHYSPLKLAEYLATGRAVVAPRTAQLAQRLDDGVDALLVEPGRPEALRAALVRLRDDPALRRRLGAGAREAATARWSWDAAVEQIVEALR